MLSDGDILQAERSLYRVRQELVTKREELSRLGATSAGSSTGRGWMGKVFGGPQDQGRYLYICCLFLMSWIQKLHPYKRS